jgi:hypothetical protein
MQVFCRVRPLGTTGDASPSCMVVGADNELAAYNVETNTSKMFIFDRVFGENSTQEEVYAETQPLIRSVLDGAPLDASAEQKRRPCLTPRTQRPQALEQNFRGCVRIAA